MMDQTLAQRNLFAVMEKPSGENQKLEKLTQAIEEAQKAKVSVEEIEEAKQMLEMDAWDKHLETMKLKTIFFGKDEAGKTLIIDVEPLG